MNDAGPPTSLRPYCALRERDLRREGLFIAEGRLVVERLLASGWDLLSVLCTHGQAAHFRELASGRCPVLVQSKEILASLAGFPFHRGVLAAGRRPSLPSLASFLQTGVVAAATAEPGAPFRGRGGPATLVVCPRLSNSENLGSIIRSAAAFGAALAIGGRSCDPFSRQAIKVSAGTVFGLPLVQLGDETAAAVLLREHGYRLLGASGEPGPAPGAARVPARGGRTVRLPGYRRYCRYRRDHRPARVAVVFGNEAAGLEEPWLSACDRLLSVPMPGQVDSLNVAVAAGIILWELRQSSNRVPPRSRASVGAKAET